MALLETEEFKNLEVDPLALEACIAPWLLRRSEVTSDAKILYMLLLEAEQAALWGDGVYDFRRTLKRRQLLAESAGWGEQALISASEELSHEGLVGFDDQLSGRVRFYLHRWMPEAWLSAAKALSCKPLTDSGALSSKRRSDLGVVYFIQAGSSGPIKIGKANKLGGRVRGLQTANAEDLRLLGSVPGGLPKEAELHERFAPLRIRGEWFRPESELLSYVAEITGAL